MWDFFHAKYAEAKRKVEHLMSQVSDLDSKLAKISSGVDDLISKLNSSIAPPPPPPPATDLTNELSAADAIQSKLDAALNPPSSNQSGSGTGAPATGVTIAPGA